MASGARCSLRHRLEPTPSGNSGSLGKLLIDPRHPLLSSVISTALEATAVWGLCGVPLLAQAGPRFSKEQRQYRAQALAPLGSSRGIQVGFPSIGELPFNMSLDFW